jgi:O-antigen/teichoic acid export membrane protein
MKKFGAQSLRTFLCQALSMLLGLACGVIVARYLGPTAKGAIALYGLIAGFLALAGNLGLGLANVHLVGSGQIIPGRAWANSLYLALLTGSLLAVLTIFLFPVLGIIVKRPVDMGLLGIVLCGVPLLLLLDYQINLLRGVGDLAGFNQAGLMRQAGRLLALGLLVVVFRSLDPSKNVASALWAANISIAMAVLWSGYRLAKKTALSLVPTWRGLKKSLSYGLKGQPGQIIQFFNYRLDLILLALFWTNREVGIYATAVFLAEMIWYIPAAVSTVLLPAVSSADSEARARDISLKAIRHTVFLSLAAAIVLALSAQWLITTLYGPSFAPSVRALQVLLFGVVMLAPAKLIVSHLAGVGKSQYVSYLALIGLGLTLLLDIILIPRFGIIGAAWASAVAYSCSGLLSLYWLKRHLMVEIIPSLILSKEDWQEYRELINL